MTYSVVPPNLHDMFATINDRLRLLESAKIDNGTNLAVITNASASGTAITYTAANTFSAGQNVSITAVVSAGNPSGASGAGFNLSNVTIASATSSQFVVTNSLSDTYTSGGIATVSASGGGSSVSSATPSVAGIVYGLVQSTYGGSYSANSSIGYNALNTATTGSANVALGQNSLYSTDGSNNTSIGFGAGYYNTGSNNVFIGYTAGGRSSGDSGSYLLRISGDGSGFPLVSGKFDSTGGYKGNVQINGSLSIYNSIKLNNPVTTVPTSTYTVLDNDNCLINPFHGSGSLTINLPSLTDLTGARTLHFLNSSTSAAIAVISSSSNVIPITGGSPGTSILPAGNGKWAFITSASDGTNWRIIASN
jgi:hypothetical protein